MAICFRFNALRALGYFSTLNYRKVQQPHLFQCTSCFGILLNHIPAQSAHVALFQCTSCFGILLNAAGKHGGPDSQCFNALRALGYFSTHGTARSRLSRLVSMHFVLWDTSQRLLVMLRGYTAEFQCTSCFGILLNERVQVRYGQFRWFQCTSCFGILLNGRCHESGCDQTEFQCTSCFGILLNCITHLFLAFMEIVSMHFVLWDTSQPRACLRGGVRKKFQCTSCFGILLNVMATGDTVPFVVSMHFVLWDTSQHSRRGTPSGGNRFNALRALGYFSTIERRDETRIYTGFNALRALGYFSTYSGTIGVHAKAFQCTSCFGILLNPS